MFTNGQEWPFSHWECDGVWDRTSEKGHFVPLGGSCRAVCANENERVDSIMEKLYCTRPLKADQWHTEEFWEMIARHTTYFGKNWWESTIRFGMTGSPHISFYPVGTYAETDIWRAYKGGGLQEVAKCHEIKTNECPEPLNDESGLLTCTDGNKPGSICTQQCNDGFGHLYDDYETAAPETMICRCTDTCEWSEHVHECSAQTCEIPPWNNPAGHIPNKCTLNGEPVEINDSMPVGTICQNDCPEGYGITMGWGVQTPTCECGATNYDFGEYGKSCAFDHQYYEPSNHEVSYCVPAVCPGDIEEVKAWLADGIGVGGFVHKDTLASGFDYYFDYDAYHPTSPNVDHFTSLNCPPDAIWSGTGDPNLDGKVKAGYSCTLGCQDGWHVTRASPVQG